MEVHANSAEHQVAQPVDLPTPHHVLVEMRSLCQVLLFHPFFHRGVKKPHVMPYELARIDDLERLVNELAIIAEVVFLHPDHATAHSDTYATLLAQVTVTLSVPEAEPKLLRWIDVAGPSRLRQDLTRLRRLISTCHASWKRAHPEPDRRIWPDSKWTTPGHG